MSEFGGSIHVDSEPGKGTRFVIRLPAAADTADEATPASSGVPKASLGALSYWYKLTNCPC